MVRVGELAHHLIKIKEVRGFEGDRRTRAMSRCGHMPAGGEELVRRLHQVIHCTTQPFRVEQHYDAIPRQHARNWFEVVHQCRDERLHALLRDCVGYRFQKIVGIRNLPDQRLRTLSYALGQLQLTAWCGPHRPDRFTIGALVGGMEAADRVDLVTEELDAHRMRFGGNKHVDDAATHRELATVRSPDRRAYRNCGRGPARHLQG